jgi:hypothetical protein
MFGHWLFDANHSEPIFVDQKFMSNFTITKNYSIVCRNPEEETEFFEFARKKWSVLFTNTKRETKKGKQIEADSKMITK